MSEYITKIYKGKLYSYTLAIKFFKTIFKNIYTSIKNTIKIRINSTKDTQDLYNESKTQQCLRKIYE